MEKKKKKKKKNYFNQIDTNNFSKIKKSYRLNIFFFLYVGDKMFASSDEVNVLL
jgi:hypothetical protein